MKIIWGNNNGGIDEEELKKGFKGEVKRDPVTLKLQLIYPQSKRMLRYLESFVISSPLLFCCILLMICYLNLNGYLIQSKGVFHIPFLEEMAEKDGIFDQSTSRNLIPTIGFPIITSVLSLIYRRVAKYLTERENHRNKTSFLNSCYLKRFIFDFFVAFIPLLYLAFIKCDIIALRKDLVFSKINFTYFRLRII